ncbi:hypothetical protein GCM10025771_09890 [Niveibacterium umoris]|uniref:DUF3825 domain-containing protein n=1 Tax=Niveibacterium umoris TaxID=1193620 RepID=A0A840BP64_9RHOO|nr:hypothetical protein [Niveibacterium umoris]MBB4013462.1 hypothetical protein [Niveibacterium umoris]
MPINDLARRYLDHFEQGLEIPGGLPHRKALAQLRLDYSAQSLERIDLLLRQMRERLKPEPNAFINDSANQNLSYLLAFYIGETISRFTGQRCDWFKYEELREIAPPELLADYPYGFNTSITCVFERDGFYVPLSPVLQQLFFDDPDFTVASSAQRVLRRVLDKPVLTPRTTGEPAPVPQNPIIYEAVAEALEFAGSATAFAIWNVMEGSDHPPSLTHRFASGKVLTQNMMFLSWNEAIENSKKVLKSNAENAQVSALTYDGFINLPSHRTDALVLELQAYQPLPFTAHIVIPYRSAKKPEGFALYAPRVLDLSIDAAHLPAVREGFFSGIRSFNPGDMWDKHYLPGV